MGRLELPHLAALGPEPSVSANSTISALRVPGCLPESCNQTFGLQHGFTHVGFLPMHNCGPICAPYLDTASDLRSRDVRMTGGDDAIRTRETLSDSPVFEAGVFDRSTTSPYLVPGTGLEPA